jgi:hypothetical protein
MYPIVDEKLLLIQLLRPLLPEVRITSTPQSNDPMPVIVMKSNSSRDRYGEFVQHWTITLMTSDTDQDKSRDAAVRAHQNMIAFGEKVTGIAGIGWVGEVTPHGGPSEYAGGGRLFQHIARYDITVRPDISGN